MTVEERAKAVTTWFLTAVLVVGIAAIVAALTIAAVRFILGV